MTKFVDSKGAAEFLKVKISTIYAWVHQKRIPYRKHGRKLVFSISDLEEWSEYRRLEMELY